MSQLPASRFAWYVVAAVGGLVIVLVFALGLFSRLDAADELVDDARPAFEADRVEGARAGIMIVSQITDLSDPMVSADGTAAAEVPMLVEFVSAESGLSQAQVLSALEQNFPKTTALLQALPLGDVSAELKRLVPFLAQTLKLSEEEVAAALGQNFPGLAQVIASLPPVADGWDQVPGTEDMTRFDGTEVTDVPSVRDYFADDVIPVLENRQEDFGALDDLPGGPDAIPPLLLVLGLGVLIFGIWMSRPGMADVRGRPISWIVVTVAGLIVVVLVVGVINAFSKLDSGQEVVDDLKPAFTERQVEGSRAGITIVSQITDLYDPITSADGTAAAEVPKLIEFVSAESGLSQDQVLAALQQSFPHTTALLQALPLTDVNAELMRLVPFLAETLQVTEPDVVVAVVDNFPGLAEVILNIGPVVRGWDQVPGTESLTRFDGTQVTDVPSVRDYFADDVVPVLERQQANFDDTEEPFPDLDVFPPLLLGVGLLVVIYGALMTVLAARGPREEPAATAP